ncbi:MAG: hypothetical protein PHC34_06530 [Candidatus Gastranaerophilales bacterium]|nr:hypothetical protein [Candidatus Gastranaerophilales bacterium]
MKELFTKDTKILILVILLILGYGFGYIIPPVISQLTENQKLINELSKQVIDMEKKNAAIIVPQKSEPKQKKVPIVIYKSPYTGTDFESAGMELVYQLLKIISDTGNKITEISLTPSTSSQSTQPQQNQPQPSSNDAVAVVITSTSQQSTDVSSTGTINVSMSLDCSYISLQNLLQRVSTWNYLAEIKNLSIEPKQNNPNKLISKLSIDLYIGQ